MDGRLVCFGDSITFGEFLPSAAAWPALLRDRAPGWRIHNRGVCGDTTRLGLERFPRDVQQWRPDMLTVQFGLNDANRWDSDGGLPRVSLDAFAANLQEMVVRARTFGTQRVWLITPHRVPGPPPDLPDYAETVRWAAEEMGCGLIDPWARMDTLEFDPLLDGVHLNEAGHDWYAGMVGDALWP